MRAVTTVTPMSERGNGPGAAESPAYKRGGDLGQTTFGDAGEIAKSDIRLAAYGACEEVNSTIGLAMSFGGVPIEVLATLASVQDDLYDLATDLSSPTTDQVEQPPVRIVEAHVERLERAYEHFAHDLHPVDGFVLPGGTVASALLFQARSLARRAERATWTAMETHGDTINPLTARYFNRLSSLLFVLARAANVEHGDTMWRPGASVSAEVVADHRP